MKRWLVAFAAMLALFLVVCAAAADGEITLTVSNAVPQNGEVSGCYYYYLSLQTDSDSAEIGWSTNLGANNPDEDIVQLSRSWWRPDGQGGYTALSLAPEEGDVDVFFYRADAQSPWQKLVMRYDATQVQQGNIVVRTDASPALFADQYTVEWMAMNGADAYFFHWQKPDGELIRTWTSDTSCSLTIPRLGGSDNTLNQVGVYTCWVDACANGKLIESTGRKEFTVKPVLSPADDIEDFVQVDNSGNVTTPLNGWVSFAVNAPGAHSAVIHAYPLGVPLTGEGYEYTDFWLDENGEGGFSYIKAMTSDGAHYTRYIVAEALYGDFENEQSVFSDPIMVDVVTNDTIASDVTYTVPADCNTAVNGVYQVPRDGRLFVDVDDIGADQYGLYIAGATEDDPWIADSHWVRSAKDGNATRVPLTVPRCEVGGDYQVCVFAIKFGAEQKDALTTIPIHVTAASTDCPVIVSMADTFYAGDKLRVFASYTNPDNLEDIAMNIRITDVNNPYYVLYEELNDAFDFWDDGADCWESGRYRVDASIFQYGQQVREYNDVWEFTVLSDGKIPEPQLDPEPAAVIMEGDGLDFDVTFEPVAVDPDAVPEWVYYALFRDGYGNGFVTEDNVDMENGVAHISIPQNMLEAGRSYTLVLRGVKPRYDFTDVVYRFVVVDPQTEQSLTLTVNGSSDPCQEIESCTDFRVRVNYPEGRPTAVRVTSGGNDWDYWWNDDGRFERSWGFGQGEYVLYAEATWDPIDFNYLDETNWEDFDWNRDVSWSARSNAIRLSITNPNGVMAAPVFTLDNQLTDGVIPWGDDLIVSLENAEPRDSEGNVVEDGWYFVDIFQVRDNNQWEHVSDGLNFSLSGGVNHIPTNQLQPGGTFWLEIGADGRGYEARTSRVSFTLGERPESADPVCYLKVNGQTDDLQIPTHTEFNVVAYHSDADRCYFRITNESYEDGYDDRDNCVNGMVVDRLRYDHAEVCTITAYACFGEGENYHEDMFGQIIVTITAGDDLGELTATMADKAFCGDQLTITFDELQNAEEYSYWIHPDYNDEWIMGESRRDAGDLTINTALLDPGVYWVELDAMAAGYNQAHGTLHFALLDPEALDLSAQDDSYYFSIYRTEFPACNGSGLVAYIPGAEEIKLLCSRDGSADLDEFGQRRGPGMAHGFGRDEGGVYTIYLQGRFNGWWGQPIEVCQITVTSVGSVAAPQAETFTILPAGQDLNLAVSFDPVGNEVMPDWADFALCRVDHDYQQVTGNGIDLDANGEGTVFVSSDDLQAGGQYQLTISGWKDNYTVGRLEFRFVVTSVEEPDVNSALTLLVNGSTAENQDILSCTNVHIMVTYPGDRPTAVRVLNGDHWEHWWGEDDFRRGWSFGGETVLIYAEASWDAIDFDHLEETGWQDFDWDQDVNWTGRSNMVRLNITNPYGQMSAPVFTLDNGPINEVIPWGDALQITVEDAGPTDTQDNIVEDGWFYLNLFEERYNGEGDSWWDHLDSDYQIHSGLNLIPTWSLHPGQYRIEIGADARGYQGRSAHTTFVIGEPNNPGPDDPPITSFTVNNQTEGFTVPTHTELQLIAFHSGAGWYNVEISKEGDDGWHDHRDNSRDGLLIDRWNPCEAGVYTLTAYAYGRLEEPDNEGNDEWESMIGSVTVTVTAENGDMGDISATLTDKAYLGDLLTLTFDEPTNAEEYSYWIHPDFDQGWRMGDSSHTSRVFTIDTYDLEPGVYWVELDAISTGYNQAHGTLHFALLDPDAAESSTDTRYFTIGSETVSAGNGEQIVAYLPGAEEIRLYSAAQGTTNLDEFGYRNGPGTNAWFDRDDAGFYDIYVNGKFNGQWDEPEFVRTVEVVSEGFVAAPQAETFDTLYVGQDLEIEFSFSPTGEEVSPDRVDYSLERVNNGHQWIDGDDFDFDNNAGTILVPADRFEAGGEYRLRITGRKPGYTSSSLEFRFMVVNEGTDQSLTLTVNGSANESQDYLSSENFTVRVTAQHRPTAVRILNGDNWEYWWGDDDGYRRDWGFGSGDVLVYAEASWDDIDWENIDFSQFNWNDDLNWTGRSNVIRLSITSPYGEMSAPAFTLNTVDGFLPWGKDLVVTVADECPTDTQGNAVNDGWFFICIEQKRWGDHGDSWWDRIDNDLQFMTNSGANVIPTYWMEPDQDYRVEIGADATGYDGRTTMKEFRLGGRQETEQPIMYFMANGQTEDFSVPTCTEVTLYAYHSGAQWYDVEITKQGDRDWFNNRNRCRRDMLFDNWRTDSAGVYTLTAYAYGHLEEPDEWGHNDWRQEIGSVTVTVTAEHGDLGELTATMTDKAYCGDQIELTLNEVADAEEYSYWIHSDTNGNWIMGESGNGREFTIDTSYLEPGVYWVELDALATGYNQTHATLHFALLDPDAVEYSNENAYYFTISQMQIDAEQGVEIVAYMPGAWEVDLRYSVDDSNDHELLEHRNGPGLRTGFGRSNSGVIHFYLSGNMGGNGWTDPVEVCTLTVNSAGPLDVPAITVNGVALTDDLSVVPPDNNNTNHLNVQIGKVDHAGFYHVEVHRLNDGRAILWEEYQDDDDPNDPVSLDVDDNDIQPGVAYVVYVDARGTGYDFAHAEQIFVIQNEQQATVSLEVQPTSDDYWTAEDVRVLAGMQGATALKVLRDDEVHYFRGDSTDYYLGIWNLETVFQAYATTDALPEGEFDWETLNWSFQAEPVLIRANTYGPTQCPSLNFYDHVTKGDWFEFTIGDDGDANQMDVRIFDSWGHEVEFRRLWAPGTYRLPTANLDPSQVYSVNISCVQTRHTWANTEQMPLYVDEPQEYNRFFRTDKTELYPNETFIPTAYAPGAEHIWITEADDINGVWGDWSGDFATNSADWEWWFDDPGEYELAAWAQYPGSEERVEIGRVHFTVLEPTPLDPPAILVTDTIDVTQDLYIDIVPVENGWDYNLQLHYAGQYNYNEWLKYYKSGNDINPDNGYITFTIPANTLVPNETYWIDCYVSPNFRDRSLYGSSASRSVMTVSGQNMDAGISLSLDEEWTQQDGRYLIPINTDFHVTVTAAQPANKPTAVMLCMGDQAQRQLFDANSDSVTFQLNENHECPETIFAKAYYGPIDENTLWGDVQWGDACEPILVTFNSLGPVGMPGITWHWATIVGHDMVIQVALGEHATEAHANLARKIGDNWENVYDHWFSMDGQTGTITIPTDGLPTGEMYRLMVDSSGEGYSMVRAEGWPWILEDPFQSDSKLVLPSALTVIGEEAFEGIAADTVIIPDGVTTIGPRAFANSNVRQVVIPATVTSIGEGAFAGIEHRLFVYGYDDQAALQCATDYNGIFCFLGQ